MAIINWGFKGAPKAKAQRLEIMRRLADELAENRLRIERGEDVPRRDVQEMAEAHSREVTRAADLIRSSEYDRLPSKARMEDAYRRLSAFEDQIHRDAVEAAREYGDPEPTRDEALAQWLGGRDNESVVEAAEEASPGLRGDLVALRSELVPRREDTEATLAHTLAPVIPRIPSTRAGRELLGKAVGRATLEGDQADPTFLAVDVLKKSPEGATAFVEVFTGADGNPGPVMQKYFEHVRDQGREAERARREGRFSGPPPETSAIDQAHAAGLTEADEKEREAVKQKLLDTMPPERAKEPEPGEYDSYFRP